MLPPALRGHSCLGALKNLEQGLLHTLTRYVSGDGGVVGLAGNLIDFVDINNAALGLFNIAVSSLDELEQDIFNVLAHVAGLGQAGGVGNGKRYVEFLSQGLGQVGLTRAGGANQENIRLGNLYVFALGRQKLLGLKGRALLGPNTLVVVVNGNR